jgi:starvation-inducible DNA-binding protein
MTTQEQLQQIFADNFVAYWRSHVAHVNVQGRNFVSDHKLLGKVYEDLQAQIDIIAELLRTLGEFMPVSLDAVITASEIADSDVTGTAEDLIVTVRADLESLQQCYRELIDVAESDGHADIANYAQDRVLALGKFLWMFDSTLADI